MSVNNYDTLSCDILKEGVNFDTPPTLVFRNWQDNNNQYLLETHSEYMINRFRYEMLNSEKAPKGKAQVLFFERNEDGNVITSMPIGENGKFDCKIPDSYGDFFVDEELKMLEL